jgi:hypothetical protein
MALDPSEAQIETHSHIIQYQIARTPGTRYALDLITEQGPRNDLTGAVSLLDPNRYARCSLFLRQLIEKESSRILFRAAAHSKGECVLLYRSSLSIKLICRESWPNHALRILIV